MTRGREKPVVMAKKTTREVVKRYASIQEAALDNGTYPASVRRECARKVLGRGDVYFRFEKDFDPNESFSGISNGRPVLAVNKRTRHWLWFESATMAGRHFYKSDSGVTQAMRKGREKDGYVFVYADRRMRSEKCEAEA